MKNAKEIKKILKEKGYNINDIKIRVNKDYDFIWVNTTGKIDNDVLSKDIAEITDLPLYHMQVTMNFKK